MENLPETLLVLWIVFCISGILFFTIVEPDPPQASATRDIHLTVPKDSSVNTQITSGNNIVNITDL